MKAKYTPILFLLLSLMQAFAVFGSQNTVLSFRRGSDISASRLPLTVRPVILSGWQVQPSLSEIRVRLYLAEDRRLMHPDETYKVVYRITMDGSYTIDSLTIGYSLSSEYTDMSVNTYPYSPDARLSIIRTSHMPMPQDITLELQGDFTCTSTNSTLVAPGNVKGSFLPATNELQLVWGYVRGADRYDVEWLFIDNSTGRENIAFDFRNATRVQVSGNYYNIPLAYPKGVILYRIRGVGSYVFDGETYPLYGKWSNLAVQDEHLPVPNAPQYRYDYPGLELGLNWQYTAAYAEEGKRKEVISFFDGSLRSRQQVTVNNSDSIAIVGESFYDHVGRIAIESMPAPTFSRGMRYYNTDEETTGNFNGIFEKADYDLDITIGRARPFPENSGAALYYSANNPFRNQPHFNSVAQISEDSGYLYVHRRYVNDGTNRLHSISGMGEGYRLGGNHATRFFYGNPPQVELDRLFGNEAGHFTHYQKALTVDPNGLVSVDYYDMKERLIASCIAGGASNLLAACDDSVVLKSVVEFDADSREYVQTILVSAPTDYTFTYDFSPADPLCDTCEEQSGCIDCLYEVVFSLWDPDILAFRFKYTDIRTNDITYRETVSLDIGNYILTKKVRLLDMGLDEYLGAYAARQSSCVEYDAVAPIPCYTVCEEYCMDKLGLDYPDYDNSEFAECVYECENAPQPFFTACDVKKLTLLADMSLGGQYFDNIRTVCPLYEDENNYYQGDPNGFLMSIHEYLDADPDIHSLMGIFQVISLTQLWDSLRVPGNWKDSYAEIMLKHHPEYPIYESFCECGDYDSQRAFDSLMNNINTYKEAYHLGLLDPIKSYYSWDYMPTKETYPDPFLFDRECCPDEVEQIRDEVSKALTCYIEIPELNRCIGVWYFLFDPDDIAHGNGGVSDPAVIEVFYEMQNVTIPALASGFGCSEDDARWRIFRSIYTMIREQYRQLILVNCVKIEEGYKFTWGQSDYFSDQYPGNVIGSMCDNYLTADTSCKNMAITVGGRAGFQIRYRCQPGYGINLNNLDSMIIVGTLILLEDCITECEANANGWMAELNDYLWTHCKDVFDGDSAGWKGIRTALIQSCVGECHKNYASRNFTIRQLIADEGYGALKSYCWVSDKDYPRIIYPRPTGIPTDCGCDNYQFFLNSHELTFWSAEDEIMKALSMENMYVSKEDIAFWNSFCIWERYDMLINRDWDTSVWDKFHFPKAFRCPNDSIDWDSDCEKLAKLEADSRNAIALQKALAVMLAERRAFYYVHCLDNIEETLTIEYTLFECGYTLYYYDQADNLIRTVPPNGVNPITDNAILAQVDVIRKNIPSYENATGLIYPEHTMITYYQYNTLDQITHTRQPDHEDQTVIYYDILSRPVISRDAKQEQQNKYSYTLYDNLGRIKETGQITTTMSISQDAASDPSLLESFILSGIRSEVTKTYYDYPLVSFLGQTRLRNRISAITYDDLYFSDPLVYQTATHYSYDIMGNVKRLIQNIQELNTFDREYITIDYDYDLISGNVNRVHFQKGHIEQFTHRYRYDADNRLTHVYTYTSGRQYLEHNDAQYFYYPHGPLARLELGDKQTQGIDYAYTTQSWLKAINGYRTGAGFDMGNDGFNGTTHSIFARDAYVTMLQYNRKDYRPISGNNTFTQNHTNWEWDLYNGNISALTTDYPGLTPLLKAFRYDKLNRIRTMETATLSGVNWNTLTQNYATAYNYDANGNILSLRRNFSNASPMHDIAYTYLTNSNRLDTITADGIKSSRYGYDGIGNLTRDGGEDFDVSWTASNKVKSVTGRNLTFAYSPLGQRQIKRSGTVSEYYIHDAGGNVLAVYRHDLRQEGFYVTERPIYGSSRIGILSSNLRTIPFMPFYSWRHSRAMGQRSYELTDHLGNVATVISDRKFAVGPTGFVVYYIPEIRSYTDYYPFGFPIEERTGVGGVRTRGYRYGFNGQEKDDEIYGQGASYTAEFWQYDARLGRRWNGEPMISEFPWMSYYACFANNPIWFTDPDGRDPINPRTGKPLRINLNRASIIKTMWTEVEHIKDEAFYKRAMGGFIRRSRDHSNKWDGSYVRKFGYNFAKTSEGAKNALSSMFNFDPLVTSGAPNDYAWGAAAKVGSYTFTSDLYSESEFFIPIKGFNIITVEKNYVTQIVNLTRGGRKDEYNINSVTTFDVNESEVQTRWVPTDGAQIGIRQEKYKTIDVKETTTEYKNNQPTGNVTTKTYTREIIIE